MSRPGAVAWTVCIGALTVAAIGGCKSGGGPPAGTVSQVPAATGNGANPPPGQPNHMSPEMQAQIEHYKSLAPGKK